MDFGIHLIKKNRWVKDCIAGKHPAWVEVVSPDLDPRVKEGTATIAELLAGERMGHFLGFADVRARRSDFRLGYENFRLWWHGDDAAGRDPEADLGLGGVLRVLRG